MPDDEDVRDIQRRHAERNSSQANSPASRSIVRQEIESALREIGVNLADWESIEQFRGTINYAREMQRRSRDAGNETRKGLIHAAWGAIVALIAGGLAAFFSVKTGGH